MIKVNIAEIKNRLSHYLRLVKGGESIEILDRKTPVAKLVRIDVQTDPGRNSRWMQNLYDQGITKPPDKKRLSETFFDETNIIPKPGCSAEVLDVLLDDRRGDR